jgi:hypothetical protein
MATRTWIGSGTSPWSIASNWNAVTVPTSTDRASPDLALFNAGSIGTAVINATTSIYGLVLNNSRSNVSITSGTLTVASLLQAAGTITIGTTGAQNSAATFSLVYGISTSVLAGVTNNGAATIAFANRGGGTALDTFQWTGSSNRAGHLLGSAHQVARLDNFFNYDRLAIAYAGTFVSDTLTFNAATDMLSVSVVTTGTGGGTYVSSVHLTHTADPGGPDYVLGDFTATHSGGYVTIASAYPCFLRGTRIATLRGDVAVEDLQIGDLVVTATAGALPIKWIGTRGFITGLVHEHHRAALLPVRIAAGALGAASPARDLCVSPEHMMCLDGVLIPAEKLLNGTTITRAADIKVVEYFHIELSRHAVLYAEGAPAESFLDTGNRNMFANVLSYLEFGHDAASLPASPPPACLPILTEGEALAAIRARLAGRAAGIGLAITEDDGLYLHVDGRAVRPASREGDMVRFAVPAGARQLRLVSRSVVPADLDPANGDRRSLGICFSAMSLHDGSFTLELAPDYAGFTTGFHPAEDRHRWTNGDAVLPEGLAAAMPNGFTLALKLVSTGRRYPAPPLAEVIPCPNVTHPAERLSA